jgi:hypothetical protein
VAHLLSALTAGAVLVVQLRCQRWRVLWPLAALPCIADRPIYVQVHSRSAFGQSTTSPRPGTCYSTLSVAAPC